MEISQEDLPRKARIEQEFDDEFGNPKLPEFMHVDKASVVARAIPYSKQPNMSTGKAIRKAYRELYPNRKSDTKPKQDAATDTNKAKSRADDKQTSASTKQSKLRAPSDKPSDKTGDDDWNDETYIGQLKRKIAMGWERGKAIGNYNVYSKK